MVRKSKFVTPDNSEDSGEAFTDGDFGDSDDDVTLVERADNKSNLPITETHNPEYHKSNDSKTTPNGHTNGSAAHSNGLSAKEDNPLMRRDSHGDQNPSIVGIIGDQHSHAEQRLAARRAARAEAREIRMRELERQQREQENNADKAYDMYAETVRGRGATRLSALSPGALHSPRRSSEDSADDVTPSKDLRGISKGQPQSSIALAHELKEVEEKFRKAMILTAQLDNDKAALAYQLELAKDRLDEHAEAMAQLQREHKEKCSAHERLKREHASLERELTCARDAVRARDAAADAAGRCFVEASGVEVEGGEGEGEAAPAGQWFGSVPPLALVSRSSEQLLEGAGAGALDVRLQRLGARGAALEAEVRALTLQLQAAQASAGVGGGAELEAELETLRRSLLEARARAARAESEAALQAAAAARSDAQLQRAKAAQAQAEDQRHQLLTERRRLQRESREALNRVEELETENSHLTKRLDKLKNAKSALLKDL